VGQSGGVSAGRFAPIGSGVVGILVAAALFAAGAAAAEVGAVDHFPTKCTVGEVVPGPDRNVWFPCPREEGSIAKPKYVSLIGRITPLGEVTEFSEGIPQTVALGHLVAGPDGNLWLTLYTGIGPGTQTEGA